MHYNNYGKNRLSKRYTSNNAGFKQKPKTKATVRKVWDAKNKFWDYEIIGDEKWKPKGLEFKTKEIFKEERYLDWFKEDNLYNKYHLFKFKDEYENQLENESNKFKLNLLLKKFTLYSSLVMIYYQLKIKFPNKKIFYYNDKLENLYSDKPSLQRLSNKMKIELPDKIEKFSNINYGIITYWEFYNAIIFKN